MHAFVKPYFGTDAMKYAMIEKSFMDNLLKHPLVKEDKHDVPLIMYANPSDANVRSEDDPDCYKSVLENVKSYHCLQLDYDSGVTIDDFISKHEHEFDFWLYTTHGHGFKPNDRFRVVAPLAEPIEQTMFGYSYKGYMLERFPGVDPSCFDRCHFQALPAVRPDGMKYYHYHVNNIGKRIRIDSEDIAERNVRMARYRECADLFEEARRNFYDIEEDDFVVKAQRILRWAQSELYGMTEGHRNETCFRVLGCLQRNGILDFADRLDVPRDFQDEFDRMLKRLNR